MKSYHGDIDLKDGKNDLRVKNLAPLLYLWPDLSLYIGQLPSNDEHSIAVDALSLNLSNLYEIYAWSDKDAHVCRSVFWQAGCPHRTVYNDDVMVFLMIEPGNHLHGNIMGRMESQFRDYAIGIDIEEQLIKFFGYIYYERPTPSSVYKDLIRLFNNQHKLQEVSQEFIDPRVMKVIKKIKSDTGNKQSLDMLAKHVNLSISRLGHLFKQYTGITIVRYRKWCRITAFLSEMGKGSSMVEALYKNGFNDSSHLCNVFKDTIGINPSSFLSGGMDIRSQLYF